MKSIRLLIKFVGLPVPSVLRLQKPGQKESTKDIFVSKLTDADGEQHETQHWIETAVDCGYLEISQAAQLLNQCLEIGRMLGSMIDKAPQFCETRAHGLKETTSEYFTRIDDEDQSFP